MTFHARTVDECWRIARNLARAYQRQVAKPGTRHEQIACLAARNAADRVALTIRYGKARGPRKPQ